jgi:hypothetical protein
MEIELSNYQERAIPKSCPAEMRAKIVAVRSQRNAKKSNGISVEEDAETLKKFAASLEQ